MQRSEPTYATAFHTPVLCHTVLENLVTRRSGVYVDGTIGGGGHSAALLDALGPGGLVLGIDRDAEALEEAAERLSPEMASGRCRMLHGAFGNLERILKAEKLADINGLLLDLGVSSHQLDTARRGFSHRAEAALDMRMDAHSDMSAADMVNTWTPQALRQALYTWGEEPRAAPIVRAIVGARPIASTTELARAVRSVTASRREAKTLARVFQAIRIAVNGELRQLENALSQAGNVLKRGGRMVVISYHSLEDRRVKRVFRHGNLEGEPRKDLHGRPITPWRPLTRKPVAPSPEEVAANPRARSARLRAAERL